MISAPIFGFGMPVYYSYSGGLYNGRMVRNFFAEDGGNYIQNPYIALFRMAAQNFNFYYGAGGGSSVPSSKPTINTKPKQKIDKDTEFTTVTKPSTMNSKTTNQASLGKTYIQLARKYSDCSEANGKHHKFCINPNCKNEDPYDQEWCTDFVTYVVKEAYKNTGRELPKGFGNHDVEKLKNWAIENKMFINTANLKRKGSFIIQNIKPGDIFIMNEDGASHTGFVTKIDKQTGVIHTIEGNRDDMVKEYKYSPNNPDLSGFIRL